jgi:hypothetical protein
VLKQHKIELGGKIFPVRFTKGNLSRTEFELGYALIGPGAIPFWEHLQGREGESPEESALRLATTPGTHYRLSVLIYAGINQALPFEQVLELAELAHYGDVMPAVMDFFRSLGLMTETETEPTPSPKPASNSGSVSGPLPASISASPAPSSGSSAPANSRPSPIAIISDSGS